MVARLGLGDLALLFGLLTPGHISKRPQYQGNHSKLRAALVRPLALGAAVAALIGIGLSENTAHSAFGTRFGSADRAVIIPTWSDPAATGAASSWQTLGPHELSATVKSVAIKKGGTLMEALVGAGADRGDAHEAITSLRDLYDPRRLKPGQQITVTFDPSNGEGEPPRLLAVAIDASVGHDVAARRGIDGTFLPFEIKKPLRREFARVRGTIDNSLYGAAERGGVPAAIIMRLIRLYSWDVDFQRDIQPADSFEIFFERLHNADGHAVKEGEIAYAVMTLSGSDLRLYRHQMADGTVDYFDEKGQSVRKALLRTPVDGARLSSRYGKRKHPVLGYNKMHRGVDFAAPKGTPIVAAGDGVIESAGRNGAYGKYVRIRHNQEYKTAYAHLSRIKQGIKRSRRVRQGDVIGYVGSTGRSTGPHLHYEVHRHGKRTNPMSVKLPTGMKLKGQELAAFQSHRAAIEKRIAQTPITTTIAAND